MTQTRRRFPESFRREAADQVRYEAHQQPVAQLLCREDTPSYQVAGVLRVMLWLCS